MSLKKLFTLMVCVAFMAIAVSCKKQNKETSKDRRDFCGNGRGFVPGRARGEDGPDDAWMKSMPPAAIDGKNIEIIVKDSAGKPENAISFAKQLIEENKVFAIIGPSTSGESMKIKSICDDAKMMLVSCAAAEVDRQPDRQVRIQDTAEGQRCGPDDPRCHEKEGDHQDRRRLQQ